MMESQRLTLAEFFRALTIGPVERRLIALSLVVGILVWPVVYALKELVHWLFHEILHWIEHVPTPLVVFIPLLIGAAITAAVTRYRPVFVKYQTEEGEEEELNAIAGDGVERTIALYRSAEMSLERETIGQYGPNPRLQLPTFELTARKFFATLATLGGGASGGLEASAALIGESMGAGVYKLYERFRARRASRRTHYEAELVQSVRTRFLQTAQIGGVSAAITVLIGTPLTASFFATEVMYRDKPLFEKLFYGLISSLAAYLVTVAAFGRPVLFHISVVPEPTRGWRYLFYLIFLAVAVTVVGQLYRVLSISSDNWFRRAVKNPVYRHLVGAIMVGIIALITLWVMELIGVTEPPLELVLGSGETAISASIDLAYVNELTAWVALIGLTASVLATLATISSGGSAGLLIPSLFFGSMIAVVISQMSGYPPMTLIPPAMTASLVAIAGTPITALLFVVEVFGTGYIIPGLVVLIVAYLMSHPNSVYRTRQDAPDEGDLLPGMEVRPLSVPASWFGKTLADLDLEARFGVQVIGLYRSEAAGDAQLQQDVDPKTVLEEGDLLALSGSEEALVMLEKHLAQGANREE